MSAHTIFDNAPIGSIIAWSDGTPQPPARFRKKLAAWQSSNSRGRLIRKQGGRGVGNVPLSASFTLHQVDYGAGGVIAIRVHRTFSLESKLHFTVVERPAIGSVRVLDRPGDDKKMYVLRRILNPMGTMDELGRRLGLEVLKFDFPHGGGPVEHFLRRVLRGGFEKKRTLYLPRLFVYHCEAEKGSKQSETFKVMERRLLRAIINPAMRCR